MDGGSVPYTEEAVSCLLAGLLAGIYTPSVVVVVVVV